eukprot:m.114421 g.114421  ORF g.114421 m.114421 type:complete len:86 (+) comp13052_c0_seq1:186-443(+)
MNECGTLASLCTGRREGRRLFEASPRRGFFGCSRSSVRSVPTCDALLGRGAISDSHSLEVNVRRKSHAPLTRRPQRVQFEAPRNG